DQHPDKKDFDSEKSDNEEKEETQEELADETKPVGPVSFDHDALVKLCGSRGKRKGVDSIELLDVGGNDYRPSSNKDYLGSSSRKTHHVTHIAKMAIERNQELKESWAQSKFNRQQARQKYGFKNIFLTM
ncbi:proline-rich PRCC, partial [Brachionus plicatilis]